MKSLFFYRVIIGAPRADTSRIQSKVYRGGAVYRCDIFDDNRCHLIPFDSAGKCIEFKKSIFLNKKPIENIDLY